MPVWHERVRELQEEGALRLVGVIQEQHPERCALFAQWKGFDWPILWDPFDVTGASAVPSVVAIDEHGIVRAVNPSPETFEEDFLFAEFPAPAGSSAVREVPGQGLVELAGYAEGSFEHEHYRALTRALWGGASELDGVVAVLEAQAAERPDDATLAFRAGVARRMRYDSERRRPGDFQAALDHWARALAANPGQYVWRRRIQQYGPRMDKPYDFYSWVDLAREEIAARGEEPVALRAELTPAELALPSREFDTQGAAPGEPDPEGSIPADEGWLEVESAVAFDTSRGQPVASVHLAFRPDASRAVHWTNDAGPLVVWLGSGETPPGWRLGERRLEEGGPARETSDEVRRFTVDVRLSEEAPAGALEGYALFYACEGVDGTCAYLRKGFRVALARPE